jgi:hypothetical protein
MIRLTVGLLFVLTIQILIIFLPQPFCIKPINMSSGDYRVADISLADFGRREIELAEHEVASLFHFPCIVLILLTDAWSYGLS